MTKLDTNGSKPEALKNILDKGLVDFVAMNIKAPLEKYSEICGVEIHTKSIQASAAALLQADIAREFRTTMVPALTDADLSRMLSQFKEVKSIVRQKFQAPPV